MLLLPYICGGELQAAPAAGGKVTISLDTGYGTKSFRQLCGQLVPQTVASPAQRIHVDGVLMEAAHYVVPSASAGPSNVSPHAQVQLDGGKPSCNRCPLEAAIGLARVCDGLWVDVLCRQCHSETMDSGIAGDSNRTGFETLALAGRCRQCRTKASYGVPSSPPMRCSRHKRPGDIARSLGASCVFEGCRKARLFGSIGGVPLFCATHRLPDHVDVKNKRCQVHPCIRQASYGDATRRIKVACAQHRLPSHVDLKHESRRCAAPEGCNKLGMFKRRLLTPPGAAVSGDSKAEAHSGNKSLANTTEHTRQHTHHHSSASDFTHTDKRRGRRAAGRGASACAAGAAGSVASVFVCAAHRHLDVFSAAACSNPTEVGLPLPPPPHLACPLLSSCPLAPLPRLHSLRLTGITPSPSLVLDRLSLLLSPLSTQTPNRKPYAHTPHLKR